MSANDPLLSNCCQRNCKRAEDLEWRSVVKIKLVFANLSVGQQRHLTVDIIIWFIIVKWGLNELEISRRGFLDSAVEVQSVASTRLIVSWLHVFEFVRNSLRVIHDEVVEAYSETTWLLRKEVTIIFNSSQLLTNR